MHVIAVGKRGIGKDLKDSRPPDGRSRHLQPSPETEAPKTAPARLSRSVRSVGYMPSSALSSDEEPAKEGNKNSPMLMEDAEGVFAFGELRLFRRRRCLVAGNRTIELGSRAFEILLTLVEARGRVVSRDNLHDRVWPRTVVEPQNLNVQIHALRKALGRYRDVVQTVTGRGYRLAMPVKTISSAANLPLRATNVPAAISPLVGREGEVAPLLHRVVENRLVTLTGPGGVGKTRLGLDVAFSALPAFPDGAWVVDLGSVVDPALVLSAIASTLRIDVRLTPSVEDGLLAVLQRKNLLLILDGCEHLIDCISRITMILLHRAPGLHVLATSRETLRIEGEHIHPVAPLAFPPTDAGDAVLALRYSSVQLFVELTQAADPTFSLDDRTAAIVSRICRRLDGLPLAIEFAAVRAATMGTDEVAKRLDDRFRLLSGGKRTTTRKHQTLLATLDSSYELLSETEQTVLRRLGIFADGFTLEAAASVVADCLIDPDRVAEHVADLVGKSMVIIDVRDVARGYRLLETTRAYALDKLGQSGEFSVTARRCADYCRKLVEGGDRVKSAPTGSKFGDDMQPDKESPSIPSTQQIVRFPGYSTRCE